MEKKPQEIPSPLVESEAGLNLSDSEEKTTPKQTRYEWLDQFRGFCIILYILAVLAFPLSGDVLSGINPILPTYYNHGWAISFTLFGDIPTSVPIPINFIDIGQTVLIFLLGMFQAHSFIRRKQQDSSRNAWIHGVNRFSIFLFLSVLFEDAFLGNGIFYALLDGVLAILAWATLVATLCIGTLSKPKHRLISATIIFIIHFFLYEIPFLREWSIGSGVWFIKFPWRLLNLTAVAIMGTVCYSLLLSPKSPEKGEAFSKYILPFSLSCFLLNFLLEFFQFANSIVANTPLVLLGMAWACLGLFVFFAFDHWKFHIPLLSEFGRNMFLFFVISPVLEWVWLDLISAFLRLSPCLDLLLVGIIPTGLLIGLALWFRKKHIIVKL